MIPRLYERMDATIDQDPRILACHPNEATSLHVYLFLLRRGRIEEHPGRVNPKSADTFYMSRILFMPEEVCRSSLEALIRNGLVTVHCNGVTVTLDASLGVTDLIYGAEYLQISGWEGATLFEADRVAHGTGPDRQRRYRERQKAQQVADREAAKRESSQHVDKPVDNSQELTASRYATRDDITEQNRTEQIDQIVVPDESGTSKSSDPPDPKVRRPRKLKPKPERISERALRGADYLRAMVLDRNPEADIGRRPWDGVKRPPNVYRQPPPDPLRAIGYRLKWADEIRLLVEKAPEDTPVTYEQVGEVIKWLWYNQPPELGAGFIVESPDSLRAKWPRIRGMMRGRTRPSSGDGTASDDVGRAREKLESLIAKANGDAGTTAGQDGQS